MTKKDPREEMLNRMRSNLAVPKTEDTESSIPVAVPIATKPTQKEKERKTRTSIALYPSLLRDMKRICYINRESVSEIVSSFIETYIQENQAALEEFEKLPFPTRKKVDESK